MTEALTAASILLNGAANVIAQDLQHWPIQLALALSVIGCLAGILAFRRNGASIGTRPQASPGRAVLYWVSLLPSFAWYVLPFLPQARFPSLIDGVRSGNSLTLAVGLVGAAVAIWNGVAAMRVVAENGKATGPAMVDFLQPAYLLDKGPYARVRHPMFLHDFLTHAGLAVAAGALMTFALLPLYFLGSAAFNLAEETWGLKPRFAGAFVAYKQRVPGYMTAPAAVREDFELTPRQALCLKWSAEGKSMKDIASIEKMSFATVNFHLNNARKVLDAGGLAQATALATKIGLI